MGDIFEKYTPVPADEWRETKAELDRLRAALAAAERERDEARGRAIAARAGWDACVSSRAMLQAEVDRLRRARDPDELESQRQANAILTDDLERLSIAAHGAANMLSESAKRYRGHGDDGHAALCALHAQKLRALLAAAPEGQP